MTEFATRWNYESDVTKRKQETPTAERWKKKERKKINQEDQSRQLANKGDLSEGRGNQSRQSKIVEKSLAKPFPVQQDATQGGKWGRKKIPPPPTQLKRYLFRGRKKKRRKRTIKRGKSIFHISSVKLSGFFFIFLYVSWLKKFFTYTR